MKVVEEQQAVRVMEGKWDAESVIRETVESGQQEDPFYVFDVGEVVARYQKWKELMPRVEPFYAVKCNDDKLLLSTLAALGTGFDCASKAEIELVTSLGVGPERIIFANPAKMASHIRYAGDAGVTTMTFDSEPELTKIKQLMPNARLVIRIRCDAAAAQCPLGIKFGCDPLTEAPRLLKLAAVMDLNVVGVSFHVGSGAAEYEVFARGVRAARALFALGGRLGLRRMRLLDLGGGFPGLAGADLKPVAEVINAALEREFPGDGVRVVAEPGRYFAAAAFTLAAMVHAKRHLPAGEGAGHTMYFINDGVYGSFNCVLYDHQHVSATPLKEHTDPALPCSVWGPTCDGLDCVLEATALPPLTVGEWLVFKDMGAYTMPVASPFNGFPVPKVKPVMDIAVWSYLKEVCPVAAVSLDSETELESGGDRAPPPPPTSDILTQFVVECLK